jgi:hypothetical protein
MPHGSSTEEPPNASPSRGPSVPPLAAYLWTVLEADSEVLGMVAL